MRDEEVVRWAIERGLVEREVVETLRSTAAYGTPLLQTLVAAGRLDPARLPPGVHVPLDSSLDPGRLSRLAGLPGPGTLVGGAFRIDSILGAGAMGGVFRALDVHTGRPVALKVMLPSTGSATRLQRFEREAQVLAGLDVPGVVRIHASGAHEMGPGAPPVQWFAMELVEGEDLDRRLERGPLPVREAAELLEAVARTLARCHAAGVVHRDLKPANIILAAGGPKVADFGLAHLTTESERLTRTGELLGTPLYMAPEQLTGQSAVDARADVYALGAVLYHALVGRQPHEADNLQLLVARVLVGEPTPPRALRPEVGADLEAIALMALQRDRQDRYPTAEALADDLARALRGEPALARGERGWLARLRRRERPAVLAAAAALLLVLAAAGGGVALHVAGRRGAAREAVAQALLWEADLGAWDLGLGPGTPPASADLLAHAAALRAAADALPASEAAPALEAADRLSALTRLLDDAPPAAAPGEGRGGATGLVVEALLLRRAGRLDEAAARLTRALQRDPAHPAGRRLEARLWGDRVAASPARVTLGKLADWLAAPGRSAAEREGAAGAALEALVAAAARETDDGDALRVRLSILEGALGLRLGGGGSFEERELAAALTAARTRALEASADGWAAAAAAAFEADADAPDVTLARRLGTALQAAERVAAPLAQPTRPGPRLLAVITELLRARLDRAVATGDDPEDPKAVSRVHRALLVEAALVDELGAPPPELAVQLGRLASWTAQSSGPLAGNPPLPVVWALLRHSPDHGLSVRTYALRQAPEAIEALVADHPRSGAAHLLALSAPALATLSTPDLLRRAAEHARALEEGPDVGGGYRLDADFELARVGAALLAACPPDERPARASAVRAHVARVRERPGADPRVQREAGAFDVTAARVTSLEAAIDAARATIARARERTRRALEVDPVDVREECGYQEGRAVADAARFLLAPDVGRPDLAERLLREAVAEGTSTISRDFARAALSELLRELGRADEAWELISATVVAGPSIELLWAEAVRVALARGQVEEARRLAREARGKISPSGDAFRAIESALQTGR